MSLAFRARTFAARTFAARTWANDASAAPPPPPPPPLPGTSVRARYGRFRVTVDATLDDPVPSIQQFVAMFRAKERQASVDGFNTSLALPPFRLGVGDVRLPAPSGTFARINHVSLTIVGGGAGYTWELVDREVAPGPRVRIYRNGQPADAVVSARIFGY